MALTSVVHCMLLAAFVRTGEKIEIRIIYSYACIILYFILLFDRFYSKKQNTILLRVFVTFLQFFHKNAEIFVLENETVFNSKACLLYQTKSVMVVKIARIR